MSITAGSVASTRNCDRFLLVDLVRLYGPDVPPPPPPPPPAPIAGCPGVIIPAYSYPNPPTFWDNAIAGANSVQFMIADPANGPGKSKDTNYVAVIARAKAAGIRVMGYVDTDYGRRSSSTMRAEITTWRTMYGGRRHLLFDQTASSTSSLAYYQAIADYVHATAGAITMFNPGININKRFLQMADILNIFEGTMADYAGWAPFQLRRELPRDALLPSGLRRPQRDDHDERPEPGDHTPGRLRLHHERRHAEPLGRPAAVLDDRGRADPPGLRNPRRVVAARPPDRRRSPGSRPRRSR